MLTRRKFLMTAALTTYASAIRARAQSSPQPDPSPQSENLPAGLIPPFQWGAQQIPISGTRYMGTDVVDKAITDVMREKGILGCGVGITRDANLIYAKGFGYAELPKNLFLPTTATRCGSLAKPITGLSALILADQGDLDLDSEILPILKEAGITPKPVGMSLIDERIAKITVRNLMDHTSGFPGGTTYTAWRIDRNVADLHGLTQVATAADVASDALGKVRLDFEPGTKYQYANANFVLLARVIEAKSGMKFNDFLTRVAMAKFGLKPDEVYVSQNQIDSQSPSRGSNEAAYYQTSPERFVSFVPSEKDKGRIYSEAYRGFASESSDGAGGIACTALGLSKILLNLHSDAPALSQQAIREILTPPAHYSTEPNFDPNNSNFYSKGFDVRLAGGQPWLAHGGMTLHCGGVIGYNAGYQFVAVSNWNNSQAPFVDGLLSHALGDSVGKIG